MDISRFSTYTVVIETEGSNISGESTGDNIFFEDYSNVEVMDLYGAKLMELITTLIEDVNIIGYTAKNNTLLVECFNPSTGESNTTKLTIARL